VAGRESFATAGNGAIVLITRDRYVKARVWIDLNVVRAFFLSPVRAFYGNDANLSENRRGARNLALVGPDLSERAQELLAAGFLRLNYPLPGPLVDDIAAEFSVALSELETDGESDFLHIENVGFAIPSLDSVLTPDLMELLDEVYPYGFQAMYRRAWRNYHWIDADVVEHNSNTWHNDQARTDILKLFVVLSPNVDGASGATEVISRHQTRRIMRRGFFSRRWIARWARKEIAGSQIEVMAGERGFTYLLNPQMCLHRAGNAPAGGVRDVAMIQFCSARD
jgi:hypothetical protein